MKNLLRGLAISGFGLIVMSLVNGCSTKETTTYVPTAEVPAPVVVSPPPRVVVNPAPVVISPPPRVVVNPAPVVVTPDESTTTTTTVEKKTDSSSSDYDPNETSERSQSSYHSETSTVSPQ